MNANEMAVEAVAMVAAKSPGLTVTVQGSEIAVRLVRDAWDRPAFDAYAETIARLWDALDVIPGCRFSKHNAGGVETAVYCGGHAIQRGESYLCTFKVTTEAELAAEIVADLTARGLAAEIPTVLKAVGVAA